MRKLRAGLAALAFGFVVAQNGYCADVQSTFSGDLESAFWACDYVASTRGVDATPVATCGAVYEELKKVKFGGDFLELLAWWKLNKHVEHERMALEERLTAIELASNR